MNFLEPRVTKELESDFINMLIHCSVTYTSLIVLKNYDTKIKRIRTEDFFKPLFLFSTINKINKCNKERRDVCDYTGIC